MVWLLIDSNCGPNVLDYYLLSCGPTYHTATTRIQYIVIIFTIMLINIDQLILINKAGTTILLFWIPDSDVWNTMNSVGSNVDDQDVSQVRTVRTKNKS